MYALTRPTEEAIQRFIRSQSGQPFSYAATGASKKGAPRGYQTDHNRIKLGNGAATFKRGADAVRTWKMFEIGWVELCYPSSVVEPGAVVAVLANHLGFWSLNACRIVYTIDESSPLVRAGFAYGTLTQHAESGEERFSVEWNREDDDSVWFDLFAFSRPNQALSCLGYPIARLFQKRFARDVLQAMLRAANE